jgi:spore coat polysaccharide biosynthesis protein SpsF (cytidylyltransferase family)
MHPKSQNKENNLKIKKFGQVPGLTIFLNNTFWAHFITSVNLRMEISKTLDFFNTLMTYLKDKNVIFHVRNFSNFLDIKTDFRKKTAQNKLNTFLKYSYS